MRSLWTVYSEINTVTVIVYVRRIIDYSVLYVINLWRDKAEENTWTKREKGRGGRIKPLNG